MQWTLRAATPADLDRLLPLIRGYHAFEHIELDESARRAAAGRLLAEPALGGIWLIVGDGEVTGYIAVCIGFSIEFGGHDAFVDELYLAPEYRGQGGGRAALELVLEEVRRRDVRALHLEVARDNDRARALYASVGFVAREKYVLMSRAV